MRFGNPLLTKHAWITAIAVSACFSVASGRVKHAKKSYHRPLPVMAVVGNDNDLAESQMQSPVERAREQNSPAQGTLRRKLRKVIRDQQADRGQRMTTPLQSESASSDSLKSDSKFITGVATFGHATSLYDFQDGTRRESNDTSLRLMMNLWPYDYTLTLAGGYSQDPRNGENSDFGDTSLSLSHKAYALNDVFSLKPSITGIAPTSKGSSVANNLTAAVRAGVGLGYTSIRLPGFSAGLSLSGGQNFNQYDTSVGGRVLTQYVLNQSASAAYNRGRFGFSFEFVHKDGRTYQGSLTEAFEHTEELGFELTKMFALAVGHTNGGSALKPNGVDSNLQVIDENNSMVYASVSMSF